MQFRVLGPLEADHLGEPIDLGSPKQREVLSFLLMHAGRSVPAERILDAVWGDTDGQNPLYIAVSRLRSAFAEAGNGEVLTTQTKAYAVDVDPESVDSVRFENLVGRARREREADPDGARADLEEALSLWRGTAWEEVRYRDFAVAEAERLEELRAGAFEDLLDLRLSAGETAEVVADAKAHHEAHPLRERPVELLMVALYRSGRQAEALRVFSGFARTLDEELGIEPSPHLRSVEERVLLHDPAVQTRERRRARAANPYLGLRAFQETDSSLFFGRDRLVGETLDRLRSGTTLVTLVGASGSGKSSIVRAGVVPAVRRGALTESNDWLVATMVPGAHPFSELEAALIQASGDVRVGRVDRAETAVLQAALNACGPDRRLLLVIDQFEELFTLTADEETRSQFLDALGTAVDDARKRVVVLLTLRADHYDLPLEYPLFADRFARGVVNVGPLLPGELELAALGPAEASGFEVEPALLATIVADVSGQAGALPLFQYTLTHLADGADGLLTVDAYAEAGGVAGALTKRADDTFARFTLDEQDACRQLFLRMVAIGADRAWTRRRLPLAEARGLGLGVENLQAVVAELVAARLVTTDRDTVEGDPTLEVAHEALLTGWWRLADWLEVAADDIRQHQVLSAAVDQWRQAEEDPSYLWEGRRLVESIEWVGTTSIDLSDDEQRFVATSRETEEASAEQLAREIRTKRFRTVGLVAALVALLAVGGFALSQALAPQPLEVLVLDAAREDQVAEAFDRGLEEIDDRLGMAGRRVRPGIDAGADIQEAIQSGPSRIVVSRDAATAFPNVYWSELGDRVAAAQIFDLGLNRVAPYDHPSWTRVEFFDHQAAFVAGALAATRTRTDVVGFVGGSSGHLFMARAGFEAGVEWVDPSVRIVSAVTPVRGMPGEAFRAGAADRAYGTTINVIDGGADVIFSAHGDAGIGVLEAAADSTSDAAPIWVIGHDADAYLQFESTAPELAAVVLTSVVRRYDRALFVAVERSRHEKRAEIWLGLADGVFAFPDHGALTAGERDLVDRWVSEVIEAPLGSPQSGIDPWVSDADSRMVPDDAPTLEPDGAVTVHFDLTPGGPAADPPDRLALGDTVLVTAQNDLLSQRTQFVAIGRLPHPSIASELPAELSTPIWHHVDIFEHQVPRDWALLERQGTASAVAVIDQPGTWVVAAGTVAWDPEAFAPVTWLTFEVDG